MSPTTRARRAIAVDPDKSDRVDLKKVGAIIGASLVAAFGAGAGTGYSADRAEPRLTHAQAVQVDSIIDAQLEPIGRRLDRMERESMVSGCVSRAQIQAQPFTGCAYLLERSKDGDR